jgi:hypothetical protein
MSFFGWGGGGGGGFHFVVCNACKILMKGSHDLLAYVKVTKNVE